MNKMLVGIIGIFILIILFPMIMTACHDIQTDDKTDVDLALSGTPPDGTCTLSTALWNDDTDSVLSAVDDQSGVLTIVSYAPATKVLTVGNVTTGATTATVEYEIDGTTNYTGFGPIVGITPLLIWLGMLGGMGWLVFSGARSRFGG